MFPGIQDLPALRARQSWFSIESQYKRTAWISVSAEKFINRLNINCIMLLLVLLPNISYYLNVNQSYKYQLSWTGLLFRWSSVTVWLVFKVTSHSHDS